MSIVHLSYDYGLSGTSGAPIAASRLHLALLRAGVDSHFICIRKLEEGKNVYQLPENRILAGLFYFFPRVFWVLSRLCTGHLLMPNIWPLPGFGKLVRDLKPDIIHIHWIGQDMVSFRQLSAVDAKIVYTLHDLTAVNAIEPHPKSDRRFAEGFTRENSSVAERWMFRRKVEFLESVRPFFIGPSDWVCNIFRESSLRCGLNSCRILNIVDPVYGYDSGLVDNHDKFTMLFGAFGGRSSPYKGWSDLVAALKLLSDDVKANMTVNVFGESAVDCEVNGVRLHFLGAIRDSVVMRDAYHKADAFAFPSRQETQGMVKAEALLCGLPVLAFDRTACAESVRHEENGWISPDGDIADYAKGIEFFYRKWRSGQLNALRPQIAAEAKIAFDEDEIVRQMISVYNSVLK